MLGGIPLFSGLGAVGRCCTEHQPPQIPQNHGDQFRVDSNTKRLDCPAISYKYL